MHYYTYVENVYLLCLYLHTGVSRMTGAMEMPLTGHYPSSNKGIRSPGEILPAVFVPSYRCLKNDWGCGNASNWTLPFKQQRDSVSWGNFNAPQCVHSTLSVPTSVVLKKLCG